MFMKTLILLLGILCTGILSFGQTKVSYGYDDSGNRISRTTINLKSATQSATTSTSGAKDRIEGESPNSDRVGEYNVLIYPNPVKSELIISIQDLADNTYATITIYDQSGRLILTQNKTTAGTTLNLSQISPGDYYMNNIM